MVLVKRRGILTFISNDQTYRRQATSSARHVVDTNKGNAKGTAYHQPVVVTTRPVGRGSPAQIIRKGRAADVRRDFICS